MTLSHVTPVLRSCNEAQTREFHAELIAKQFKYARPGVEDKPWGSREMSICDPSGNRLTFVATDGDA